MSVTFLADQNPAYVFGAIIGILFAAIVVDALIDALARWGRDPLDQPLSDDWPAPQWPERPERKADEWNPKVRGRAG